MSTTEFDKQLVRWRQHLHRIPETGFKETCTSDYLGQVLAIGARYFAEIARIRLPQ